ELGRAGRGAGREPVSGRAEPPAGARGVPERGTPAGRARPDRGRREGRHGERQPGHHPFGRPRALPSHAGRVRAERAGAEPVQDHDPAVQAEEAGPGRYGQELGHRHQAAVPVRGEVMARAVLVTGASRGIGRAVARAFAELGDRVAVHYGASAELAAQVVSELPGSGHTVVQADLADPEAVRRMVDQAHADLGGLDVLVNNAGTYQPHAITEVSYEQWQDAWREVLAVNLTGAANVTWCAVQYMKATGGRIVNVTSRGAYRGEPRHPAYGASKAGLNSFGQSMARALGPFGIAVASVAPGFVETAVARPDLDSARGEEIKAQSPFNRVAATAEIAAAVVYLASEQAEWASGAVLDLNGASYLR